LRPRPRRAQQAPEAPAGLGAVPNLGSPDLGGNQLSGSLPQEIGSLTKLYFLNLGWNQLSGSLPPTLAALANVEFLNLTDNQFDGPIPPSLGSLPKLEVLFLGGNRLSGAIPPELGNLATLQQLSLMQNALTGEIPASLGGLSLLHLLHLSGNALTGEIPASLTNLSAIGPPGSSEYASDLDLAWNGLYSSSAALRSWVELRNPGWMTTQTIAPSGFAVQSVSSTSVTLRWTPIAFSSGPGRYEVRAETPGLPAVTKSTANKLAGSLVVSPLEQGRSYSFTVRTISDPHSNNPLNSVTSAYAGPVAATTPVVPKPSVSIADLSVDEGDSGQHLANLTISLSATSSETVTVPLAPSGGTATAPDR